MFQYKVSHVAWPCCYTILVTLLPCCHASRHGNFMFHWYVALLPFTSNLVRNKQNMRMFHMYVSGKMTWWDKWCTCLWDEMQLVEAKHRGCYNLHPWVPPSSFTWIGSSYLVTHLDARISPNMFHQLIKTKLGLSDSCYPWWLSPLIRLGDSRGLLNGIGDCCRLRSIGCEGLLCSFPTRDSQRATLVES